MFVKINELYNFFVKSGFQGYANILEKFALEESNFEKEYPKIYAIWDESKTPPLSAYIAQISRAEDKGIDLNKERISSFQDIIKILRGEKQREKSSKAEEILNSLKEEGINNITKEKIGLAFAAGLNEEEIVYLAKDKCNHTWEEKLHYADRFKKERLALFDENAKLTDFKDIDEVRDEYFSRKNAAPLDLQKFYEGIKDQALKDSEVIYNSKNFIVAHSKTEKAAQYWEQSCVTVDEKGVVSSGLCSAHPYESFFNFYDDKIHSFQIITKEYETLKETPRTSFVKNNKEYNLITLSINKRSGEVAWGGQDTVNRYNEQVEDFHLFIALGDEYEEICKKISEYCKKYLNLDVKNLKISKEKAEENMAKMLPPSFFSLAEKIPKDIFDKLALDKAMDLSPQEFFSLAEKIPKDIFDKLAGERVMYLLPQEFFELKEKIPKGIFDKLVEERAEALSTNVFFKLKELIPKNIFDKFAEKRAKALWPNLFTMYEKIIPKDIFEKLIKRLAEERPGSFQFRSFNSGVFFRFKELIPKDIFDKFAERKAGELSLEELFELKELIPKDIFDKFVEDKAKDPSLQDSETLNTLKEHKYQ